jgi:hypothetical protein
MAAVELAGCADDASVATGEGAAISSGDEARPRRRRRRRRRSEDLASAAVAGEGAGEDLRAVTCPREGGERPAVRCPQCPREPQSAAIVRSFVAIERSVIRCRPPTDSAGRLGVRVQFAGDGAAEAVSFVGVRVRGETRECLARVLCGARLPTFRDPVATVAYEYRVLVPEG